MTAPESTPSASTERAKAIARDIKAAFIEAYSDAAYSYSECPKGDLEDRAEDAWQKSESKKIADHAAIQRGDGQTKADLALAEEYANAIIRHSESYGSVAKGFALACFDEVIRKAQLLSTPPAAKPNETSGATPNTVCPRTEAEWQSYQQYSDDHFRYRMVRYTFVALMEDELNRVRRELAAVRKSAGAEGVSESFKQADKALLGIKLRCYEAQSNGSKMTAYELAATILDENESAFDAMTDRINRKLLTAERTAGAVAKSTPGADAVGPIEEALITADLYMSSFLDEGDEHNGRNLARVAKVRRAIDLCRKLRAKQDADERCAKPTDGASGGRETV